jgi:hypothetical protein
MVVAGCPAPHMLPRAQRRRIVTIVLVFVLGTLLCYARFQGMAETARRILPQKFDDSQPGTSNSNTDQTTSKSPIPSAPDLSFADVAAALQQPIAPMMYGTYARPSLRGLVPLATLPASKLPTPPPSPYRRLILIGDVHGQLHELRALLDKVGYSADKGDHVIFTGDMISKGPDSRGVVALAMEMRASAVRGNHEDRVLLAWENAHARNVLLSQDGDKVNPRTKRGDAATDENKDEEQDDMTEPAIEGQLGIQSAELGVAQHLSAAQRAWLASLPVILKVGPLPGYGHVVVVHAGLVPGVPLKSQDPWAAMHMRTLVYPEAEARRAAVRQTLTDLASERAGKHVDVADADVDREIEAMLKAERRGGGNKKKLPGDVLPPVTLPKEDRGGRPWSDAWNEAQRNITDEEERMTVVYGHDARTGLKVGPYTFGIDTNCARGKRLTALVLEPVDDGSTVDGTGHRKKKGGGGSGDKNKNKIKDGKDREQGGQGIGHSIVSVECSEAVAAADGGEEPAGEQRRRKRNTLGNNNAS